MNRLLTESNPSPSQRLDAVRLATASLRQLHRCRLAWRPRAEPEPLSHGDATWENVIVDGSRNEAHWIDFDMRHRSDVDHLDRQADDLRALLGSVAQCWPAKQYDALAEIISRTYGRGAVWERLRQRFATQWSRPNTFHLAQAPLAFHEYSALRKAVDRMDDSIAQDCGG